MIQERFSRVSVLVGEDALSLYSKAHVCIVGFGAVGSFAAEALARSGVGFFRLIDGDTYSMHHINRQLCACQETLGKPKAEVGAEHIRSINPSVTVEGIMATIGENKVSCVSMPFCDGHRPDIILDAIDMIDAKVELIVHCFNAGIPIVSSMGAARKLQPSEVRFDDISRTSVCPLAREVRKRLREHGITEGIGCVYSQEPALKETHHAKSSSATIRSDNGISRPILGSISTVTGTFGLRAAAEMLRIIEGNGRTI